MQNRGNSRQGLKARPIIQQINQFYRTISRPFRAVFNFVASFVGNFVESDRESSREGAKPRRMGAANARE
jgi:hypothetical protein